MLSQRVLSPPCLPFHHQGLLSEEGIEPSWIAPPDSKPGASACSATRSVRHVRIFFKDNELNSVSNCDAPLGILHHVDAPLGVSLRLLLRPTSHLLDEAQPCGQRRAVRMSVALFAKHVPRARIELARVLPRQPLKLVCLPFHHLGIPTVLEEGFEPSRCYPPDSESGASTKFRHPSKNSTGRGARTPDFLGVGQVLYH